MLEEAGDGFGVARAFLALRAEQRAVALERLSGEELTQLDLDVNELVRASLPDWCRLALAPLKQKPARHHLLLLHELEELAAGRNDRLMVMMPPGSAKSTYTSGLFPAWFMASGEAREMPRSIIGTSHTAGLAEYWSARVLGFIREHSEVLGLRLDTEGVQQWGTVGGSEYKPAGVGGAIAGRRADLALIDDPIKSRKEANSLEVRQAIWDWYRADLLTRLKPEGRIVLIMTRWHEDDLAGRLLELEADRWRVLRLPAMAEPGDLIGREEGEALWPDWEPLDILRDKRGTIGEADWASLYQQRPTPAQGAIFEVGKVVIHQETPPLARKVRAWDLAATDPTEQKGTEPDWTCGALLGLTTSGRYVLLDMMRLRGGPEKVEKAIVDTAKADGPSVEIGLPQDPGQAGKSQIAYLTSKLPGFVVKASPESGSKATRAAPVAAQCNVGNLAILRAHWNVPFVDELRTFPSGRKDDQVDAMSRAFSMLVVAARPARPANINHMAR